MKMKRIGLSVLHFLPVIVTAALSLAFMANVRFNGDEITYYAMSQDIYRFFFGAESEVDLVGNGWFMPGMGILIFPVQILFEGNAPYFAIRLYIGAINLLLIIYILWILFGSRGEWKRAYIAQFFMIANVYYMMAITTIWAELLAVHLAIVFLIKVSDIYKSNHIIAFILNTGFFSAIVTFLRPLYIVMPLLIVIALMIDAWGGWKHALARIPGQLAAGLAIGAIMLALMSPWSLEVSQRYGAILTVTSQYLSRIVWLGDEQYVSKIRSNQVKNVFHDIHPYLVAESNALNTTYMENSRRHYQASIEGIDLREKISSNFTRFFAVTDSHKFPRRFLSLHCDETKTCLKAETVLFLYKVINVVWLATLALGALLFVIPYSVRGKGIYNAYIFKALATLICVHPFIVYAHGRYYSQLIPLIALAAGGFSRSDVMLFLDRIRNPGRASIVELGQIVAWMCAVAVAAAWITGYDPLL